MKGLGSRMRTAQQQIYERIYSALVVRNPPKALLKTDVNGREYFSTDISASSLYLAAHVIAYEAATLAQCSECSVDLEPSDFGDLSCPLCPGCRTQINKEALRNGR